VILGRTSKNNKNSLVNEGLYDPEENIINTNTGLVCTWRI